MSTCSRHVLLAALVGIVVLGTPPSVTAEPIVYSANLRAGTVSAIDVATRRVIATIRVGEDPNGVAVSPDGRFVYVTNFLSDSVSRIDTGTHRVTATIAVASGPVGLAVAPDGATLYAASKNADALSVVDTSALEMVAQIPTGGSGPNAIALTSDGGRAYVTNSRSRSLSVIDPQAREVVDVIAVDRTPTRVAVHPSERFVYVTNFDSRTISIVDATTHEVDTINVISSLSGSAVTPSGLALTADGAHLYVGTPRCVLVVDTDSLAVVAEIPTEGELRSVAVTSFDRSVYVSGLNTAEVLVIDDTTLAIADVICADRGPFALAIGAPETPGIVAHITAPLRGSKLRKGTEADVRIRVRAGASPSWTLTLLHPDGSSAELAAGDENVDDEVVVRLVADDLSGAGGYVLALRVEDGQGSRAETSAELTLPEPGFSLIPVEPTTPPSGFLLALDGSGQTFAFENREATRTIVDRTDAGETSRLYTPLAGVSSLNLSRNGQNLVFNRSTDRIQIVRIDVATERTTIGPEAAPRDFSVDAAGERAAFMRLVVIDEPDIPALQFFYGLWTDRLFEVRQLTAERGVINHRDDPDARRPVISGDGSTIVFASPLRLAGGDPDPSVFWRVYAYDVATDAIREVVALAVGMLFADASISDDGRWLAFSTTTPSLPGVTTAALLDVQTGALEVPLGGMAVDTADAVISPDASTVLLTATADLDPRVGNADGNRELFAYDLTTGAVAQMTETIGEPSPKSPFGRGRYRPAVNDDGSIAGVVMVQTGFACPAAGAQRDEETGFYLGRARAVRKRPGNTPPVLSPVGDLVLRRGQGAQLMPSATDPDGDSVSLFVQEAGGIALPPGIRIEASGDGSAWLAIGGELPAGEYLLRIGAFDEGGGQAVEEVRITVCDEIGQDGGCAPVAPPTVTATRTATRTPSSSPTATATVVPTASATATGEAPPPTATSTALPTSTLGPTATATATRTASSTPSPTASAVVDGGGGGDGCDLSHRPSRWPVGLLAFALMAFSRRRRARPD